MALCTYSICINGTDIFFIIFVYADFLGHQGGFIGICTIAVGWQNCTCLAVLYFLDAIRLHIYQHSVKYIPVYVPLVG